MGKKKSTPTDDFWTQSTGHHLKIGGTQSSVKSFSVSVVLQTKIYLSAILFCRRSVLFSANSAKQNAIISGNYEPILM